MSTCCLLATTKVWHSLMPEKLTNATGIPFYLCDNPEMFSLEYLDKLSPRYVFFPHWSWIIPEDIWSKYECIIFHMTDLPFGRGGSPLQNLIEQGFSSTKLTALRCIAEIDAGPIYLKTNLSLEGTAQDILNRAVPLMEEMIIQILSKQPTPIPQTGQPTFFTRRKPQQSNISALTCMQDIYNHIRMLDAEGYPKAFLETASAKFEFSNASFTEEGIQASVTITLKNNKNEQ